MLNGRKQWASEKRRAKDEVNCSPKHGHVQGLSANGEFGKGKNLMPASSSGIEFVFIIASNCGLKLRGLTILSKNRGSISCKATTAHELLALENHNLSAIGVRIMD